MMILLLGMVIGFIISFLLLADNKKITTTDLEKKLLNQADSLILDARLNRISARKKESVWSYRVDSLKDALDRKPKIIYKDIDEKINTDVRVLVNDELDSILTNYRFKSLTKERDN